MLLSLSWSQTAGKVRGTVSSADGQPLVGANVVIDGTAKGAATDGDGGYTILGVDAGTYSVTVSYIGYQSNSQSNVEVKVGLTTPLDFAMQTSAVEGEIVTIVGEKRLIEPSATNSVRSIGEQEIRNSASRSVVGVLDLQPGVNITNGRISVRGSRAEEVAYTLDGAAITDVINTGFEFAAIPEAIAEISVEAGGYGAHVGGANSGVIRQTLKTGSSKVGGDVRFETGDYGLSDLTATVNVPIGSNIKTFVAINSKHVDDWDPTYWTDFEINGGTEVRIESDGDLHVEGNVIAYSTTISDERLKKDIVKIDNALDKVSQLSGYTFEYKADGKKSAGVIAQELEKAMPSAVSETTLPVKMGDDDTTEYKVVQYDQLHGLMIEAIKELKAEIEELKDR